MNPGQDGSEDVESSQGGFVLSGELLCRLSEVCIRLDDRSKVHLVGVEARSELVHLLLDHIYPKMSIASRNQGSHERKGTNTGHNTVLVDLRRKRTLELGGYDRGEALHPIELRRTKGSDELTDKSERIRRS
jgi:hypothetical protein